MYSKIVFDKKKNTRYCFNITLFLYQYYIEMLVFFGHFHISWLKKKKKLENYEFFIISKEIKTLLNVFFFF